MDTFKSVFGQSEEQRKMAKSRVKSPDGSCLEEDSPTHNVTIRKGTSNSDIQELRNDFQSFQTRILAMLETWLGKQDEKFAKFYEDFNDIKTSIKFMNENYEDLKFKTEELSKRMDALEIKQNLQTRELLHLNELEFKLDTMEQQARMSNIEISNLPEKRGENLPVILENIASNINVPLNKQDVVSIHRVPHASNDNTRPKNIIVKFSSRILRDNILSAIRLKKGIDSVKLGISGSLHKIYVNEHLTLKNKSLFRETREAARKSGYRFVWVKHGTILVRAKETSPVIAIRSKTDLSKITKI